MMSLKSKRELLEVLRPTIVFYGIMPEEITEEKLLQKIESFKKQRGLLPPKNTPIEVKWQKVEDEWKEAQKQEKRNRYEDFLDIFFNFSFR